MTWNRRWNAHAVQYITWDQNWVMRAGLMPERVKRVWIAVKCDAISLGVGDGGESGKSDCNWVTVDAFRPLENVARIDCCKLLDGVTAVDGAGEGDSNGGIRGLCFVGVAGGFFFVTNGRNIDHSGSNWTEPNSERSGVCSRSATSRSSSIFLSALRMMKTIESRWK